jgi:hypothetical protein
VPLGLFIAGMSIPALFFRLLPRCVCRRSLCVANCGTTDRLSPQRARSGARSL